MRILKLTLKNINSLAGENEIDFTQPIFTNDGLFAITGKTGAGKSSILDAISLGLYGKTPRVDVTGNSNPVMTRGENDCYAEVMFKVDGKVWKSSWKQELTRTGNLKPVSRQIASADGKIIADQVRSCDAEIVKILGLSFEQFTKVIMLAQGSFAAFLQADKNEKGELLEQITGTEIYGKISRNVFEKSVQERKKLDKIKIELDSIHILDSDEIQALKEEIETSNKEKIKIDKELENLDKAKNWLAEITELSKAIETAKESIPALTVKLKVAEAKVTETNKFVASANEKYQQQKPIFKKVNQLDTQIAERKKALAPILKKIDESKENKLKLGQKISDYKLTIEKSKTALDKKESWAKENKKYEKLVNDFTAIDQKNTIINQYQEEVQQLKNELDALEKDHSTKKVAFEKMKKSFTTKSEEFLAKEKELSHKKEELSTILGGKEPDELQAEKERKTNFTTQLTKLITVEKNLISTQKEVENYQQVAEKTKKESGELTTLIEKDKKESEQIQSTINLLTENIQLAKKVQSLEDHRNNLKDGEPCPLCGAEEHPYASGNIPTLDDREVKLENEKAKYETLSTKIQANEKKLSELNADHKHATQNKERELKKLSELTLEKSTVVEDIKTLEHDFTISVDPDLLQHLTTRLEKNKSELQKISALIHQSQEFRKAIIALRDTVIPQLSKEKETAKTHKNEAETEYKLVAQKLKDTTATFQQKQKSFDNDKEKFLEELNVYGVSKIEDLKKCLNSWEINQDEIKALKTEIDRSKNEVKLFEKELESLDKVVSEKEKEKAKYQKDLDQLNTERKELFGDKLVDEEEKLLYEAIKNAQDSLETSKKERDVLKTELEKTTAVLKEKENTLQEKSAKKLTDKTTDEITAIQATYKAEATTFVEKIGEIRERLRANNENINANEKKLKEKEKQAEIYKKWKNLDNLIGSSDGKKYRNFAQALTFEHLIGLANKQLQKMSDRYILKRFDDKNNPFELSVIDKFQNNDERTAQNLSGGEKFIVSLSLALGLSTMASKNMRIDTMFIDEGFGTLDSDYLDVALNALSNLQNDGKIIGVISHIAELKERIATHIEIVPGGNGSSKVAVS